ncbi:MAG: sialidase family protein [Candidatus Eiseniibacteriota bacterium]
MWPVLGLCALLAVGTRPASPVEESPARGVEGTASAPVLIRAADGGYLAAWESRSAGRRHDVLFSRRLPGPGGEWSSPPTRLDTDPAGAARSLEPRLAAGPQGLVVAAWQDARNGRDDVYLNRSLDGGRTWLERDVRPESDAPGAATSSMISLAASGGTVFLAWEDQRNGERDIRFTRSVDGGALWEADRRVDSDSAGVAASFHPQIAGWADGALAVIWWDERDGLADVYLRRSRDAGASWEAPEVRLDGGAAGATGSHGVRIAVAGDSLLVQWTEGVGEVVQEVERVSGDRGRTFAPVRAASRAVPPPNTVVETDGSLTSLVAEPAGEGLRLVRASVPSRTK